ncbi:hypothetical protein Golomagni_03358, partial [Golovinomyces magnicellulatus]
MTATNLVAITTGSDSDLPVLKPGFEVLEKLQVPFHVTITSAHRTPHRMIEFASSAATNGIEGGAAHLPGMIAACTTLPVIGVPVRCATLDCLDSLLSIVQMPRGVPIATVAINNTSMTYSVPFFQSTYTNLMTRMDKRRTTSCQNSGDQRRDYLLKTRRVHETDE